MIALPPSPVLEGFRPPRLQKGGWGGGGAGGFSLAHLCHFTSDVYQRAHKIFSCTYELQFDSEKIISLVAS